MIAWIEFNEKSLLTLKRIIPEYFHETIEICFFGIQGNQYVRNVVDALKKEVKFLQEKSDVFYRLYIAPENVDDEICRELAGGFVSTVLARINPMVQNQFNGSLYRKAVECLLKYGIVPEIQMPVLQPGFMVKEAETLYRSMLDYGVTIMELEHVSKWCEQTKAEIFKCEPEQYGNLLISLFDLWQKDRMQEKTVQVREFENLAGAICGGHLYSCGLGGLCNGNCLRVKEKVSLCGGGNLKKIPEECRLCRWVGACHQGCILECPGDGLEKNYFCSGYKNFFDYAIPRMLDLLRYINRQR